MKVLSSFPNAGRRAGQSGVSLIIVLVMMVVIGLASAAAIRSATSGEKVTNNIRLQNLAQQYAEAGLRYCENELALADGARVATLQESVLTTTVLGGVPGWSLPATWTDTGGISASKSVLPASQIRSTDSAFTPGKLPECVVERQTLADTNISYVITARGFSPGYAANSTTGKTENGSVVWLQSTIFLN